MNKCLLVPLILLLIHNVLGYIVDPGPTVRATQGRVWPQPQLQSYFDDFYAVKPNNFRFKVTKHTCAILEKALEWYRYLLFVGNTYADPSEASHSSSKRWKRSKHYLGYLEELDVDLETECVDTELPFADMNEEYALKIGKGAKRDAVLIARSIWGMLRGLETFSQLVYFNESSENYFINATEIADYPRFQHRGLLLDTSRHFLPLPVIMQNIDAMSFNKLNVFHWHIVDDHSFPYTSIKYPELSKFGAYHKSKVYTQRDVKEIIEYARLRGIRVMVEFDTPGHTRSWGEGKKDLLTPCYSTTGLPSGKFGPIDPSKNSAYDFLQDFFKEISDVFPEKYLHFGGDEVDSDCWSSNPDIKTFMTKLNITGDYTALQRYYTKHLLTIAENLRVNPVVWEEVFVHGQQLPSNAVVHVWKSGGYDVLSQVTKAGVRAIFSGCWYLDHLQTGGDWYQFYNCDPYDMPNINDAQRDLIVGGEACMWAEVVNEYNVAARVWPRASATAEKLWSRYKAELAPNKAAARLEEHVCRMNRRSVPAQPANGPGYCVV